MASKNRKNKVKFKWTKELIILICCLVAMITATIVMSIPTKHERFTTDMNTAIAQSEEASSSSLSKDNVIYSVSHKELLKKVNKEEYVVVIYGTLDNTTLAGMLPTINNQAKNLEKKVYFYSSDWVKDTEDTDTAEFKEKVSKLGSDFKYDNAQEFNYLKDPAILVFHNGKIVMNTQEYDSDESYNWNMYINKALMYSFESNAN